MSMLDALRPRPSSPSGRAGAALLRNYLGEARAVARRGGGNLWVVEPALPPDRLRPFATAVVRHLAASGVGVGDARVVPGSSSACIEVLGDQRYDARARG